ncbi:hypothetical protein AHAS_Ahas20G0176100 [Arachis hypogaea]
METQIHSKEKKRSFWIKQLGYLYNIFGFYVQFLPIVLEYIDASKKEIETELKELVKLCRWDDSKSYASIEKLKKSRQKLKKLMQKYTDSSGQWEIATYYYYYPLLSGASDTHHAYSGCANEPSNTASHGVQSDPAIVVPSRAGSCGKRQTTSNGTQDTHGQGTSAATGHSSTSVPKLRYNGAKCWHLPKPSLKRISQVFKENYNKPWLSFDEADDDSRKIWSTEWKVNFNYYITVINSIKLYG